MDLQALDQSRDLLLASRRPLLVTHVAPDGDAIGSLLALGRALEVLGKEPVLSCQDLLPHRFDFLSGFTSVTDHPHGAFDLLISLDSSDPDRIGKIGTLSDVQGLSLLNVDHHATNLMFGTVNLVDAQAVSTTQVLYHLIEHLDVPLDLEIATCLLTGLVTDTRGFRTANVTAAVLEMAAELAGLGAPLPLIARQGLDLRSFNMLRLWGVALARLEMEDGLIWVDLPLSVQLAVGQLVHGDYGLSNLLITTEGAQASVVLTEREDGQVEVGFRAVPGFDVAEIALTLGGGGHVLASGCTIPGPLEEARRRVLDMLHQDLLRQRQAGTGGNGRHSQSR